MSPKQQLKILKSCSESLFKSPDTLAIKSGHVVLKNGEECGRHNTQSREEILVIMKGAGAVKIDGQKPLKIKAPSVYYIPPKTWHNVKNTSSKILDYVYITAPINE